MLEEHKRMFAATDGVSALGDCVSCAREDPLEVRPLKCMRKHNHWNRFLRCEAEDEGHYDTPVKFFKSEPVQHKKTWAAQNEWVHDELPIIDFLQWFEDLYESSRAATSSTI
jgi:hypothetical protein